MSTFCFFFSSKHIFEVIAYFIAKESELITLTGNSNVNLALRGSDFTAF